MKIKENSLLIGSFFVPFTILIVLWIILGIVPFGNNNLLASDLGSQYLPFLSNFKSFVEEGNLTFYSFSNGIGDTIFPLSSYYLLSPFNLLTLFFPHEQLPVAIVWIITLKISCIGMSMFYYLKKTYIEVSPFTWIFSTAFSLCGFTAAYSINFMWLDILILFPLLALGLQKLWQEKRVTLYVTILFLSIFTNYYMGYMTCIFAVGYSIYLYLKLSAAPSILGFIKEGKIFFISSFLSGISTSFILLPALEGMMQTKKTDFNLLTFLPYPKFGLSFFSQFGIGSVDFNLRLEHLPTVFSGILIVLLFLTYFLLPSIPKKEKKLSLFLILFLFLSFWIELINTVWHMFQSPAGFPYRNTFIFSFIVIKFAYEAFLRLQTDEKLPLSAPLIYTICLMGGYSALFLFNKNFILSYSYSVISLVLIWLYYVLLNHRQKAEKGTALWKIFGILLTVSIFMELGLNYWISVKEIPFGNQQAFEQNYKKQAAILAALKKKDFERFKQTIISDEAGYTEKTNGYNDSILYGYAGVSSYTSTLHSDTQDMLNDLGLYQKNDRRIAYVDDSQVVNFLLNVSYQITPFENTFREAVSIDGQTVGYKNPEAVGMGFLVSEEFANVQLMEDEPIINQENLLQALKPEAENYFKPVQKTNETISPDEKTVLLETITAASGELYFYLPNVSWSSTESFSVNGKKIEPNVYIKTNQLFNLGYYTKGDKVTLTLKSRKKINLEDMELVSLDQRAFDAVIASKRNKAIDLRWTKMGELFGNISVKNEDQLLYLSVPYDKNWLIKSNGKAVEQIQAAGNLMAIPLKEGTHSIAMVYRSMSYYYGLIITFATIFSFLFFRYWLYIKKKRELNKC
ncbi:YfhO family protein [Enterococcus sp. CWB-B31]|uniref:YfhO family protein n=1 Tax=Enterococcus sp. CWB-B31 TaxID=2885159 RepID=UPI001E411E86|nr:YfhO family protein [Enterococcus sp. CWB-B31]MCB5954671.1 YfhO family protein [Enterococcus sp. CWB-B31]